MRASRLQGSVWVPGTSQGSILQLDRPISFWGGVNPDTGTISDPRHPNFGTKLEGRMLTLERTIGSSSSSSVLLELIRGKHAPAGILLGEGDAILALGSLVARELGWHPVPMVLVRPEELAGLPDGAVARILSEGVVEVD